LGEAVFGIKKLVDDTSTVENLLRKGEDGHVGCSIRR
jgi:hypothetical protein